MNVLNLLRTHQHDAEFDTAVWIADHDRARRIAGFLAHHRLARAAVLVLASPVLAGIAAWWAIREAGRVIDRTHEVAGKSGRMCPSCVNHEAKILKCADEFTVEDFIGLCDLAELRGAEGGDQP